MAEAPILNPVIRFEPDGYDAGQSWLMGRQVAGAGFLRAAVEAREEGPLYGYTASRTSAQAFARAVNAIDPTTECRWIRGAQLDRIGAAGGVLYLADPTLPPFARARLRVGVDAYSLCGVTHTTASSGVMQTLADLFTAPTAPWDALVCTSNAVAETVRRVHEAEAQALRWRFGGEIRVELPQLPVIPLGVHCADFAFDDGERAAAREALGVGADEVAALFVGRLTFTGKHHPFAMYQALEAAAARTGKRLVLLLCGWAPNDAITEAFTTGAAQFAPSVRLVTVEGRDGELRRRAWAAGDIFVSLSDGIQETFGLTPIEAMAAGLPCVVSDWDGYKDTVRDGVDGFRIPTWAPMQGGAGDAIAREQEVGETDYDAYLWAAAAATSVDLERLAERLGALIADPELRRRMGEAGRSRARETFDWRQVIGQYQTLWGELGARRAAARESGETRAWLARAPRRASAWLSPFHAFEHYPSALIGPATRLTLSEGAGPDVYRARRGHPLFSGIRLPEATALAMLERLAAGPLRVAELAAEVRANREAAVYFAGVLAKMGLVRLD